VSTIYALSSGAGLAAIAVVRVSGSRAGEVVKALTGGIPKARRATVRRLRNPDSLSEIIDQALVLWMPGPRSFTGEDMVEFHVHGGRAVVAALMGVLSRQGLRLAEAGEFTRRAFEAGRLDLTAVEGLADLVAAESEAQREQALFHQQGGAAAVFDDWRRALLAMLARFEASIDFAEEEDVATAALADVDKRLAMLEREMRDALASAHRGERIREGVRVVIAGPPNAGKSTLLNRLAGREAAIVSHFPGTTRDVIEVHLELEGMLVVLADTAGVHARAIDVVEAEGMARTRRRLAEADVVLWVEAPDSLADDVQRIFDSPTLRIWNKMDLGMPSGEGKDDWGVRICAQSGVGVDDLVARLTTMVAEHYGRREPALVTRERQQRMLKECCDELDRARQVTGGGVELEAEHIRLAARALGRLTGRIDVEELLGTIFAEFCIGK